MAKRHSGSSRIRGSCSSAWQDLRTHQSSDGGEKSLTLFACLGQRCATLNCMALKFAAAN
jgi:hypothetical protein